MNSYSFEHFLKKRREVKLWLQCNGYNNGDPEKNGEYRLIDMIAPQCAALIDIGYNEGIISKRFKNNNSKISILGIEPNLNLPSTPTQTKLLRIALSDISSESADFFIHKIDSGVSSLNIRLELNPSFRKDFNKTQVSLRRLDEIFQIVCPKIDGKYFLKIDVEGSEAKVIRGGREMFNTKFPIGYFEYSSGWKESNEELQSLFYYFDESRYSLYRITPFGLEWIRFFHVSMENYLYQNLFFAPKEFLDSLLNAIPIAWEFGETLFYKFPD